MLRQVSGDRIRHELNLILLEEKALAMLHRLKDLGLLVSIHPALYWNENLVPVFMHLEQAMAAQTLGLPPVIQSMPVRLFLSWLIWLNPLSTLDAESVCGRLRFSRPLSIAILEAISIRTELPQLVQKRPAEASRHLTRVPDCVLVCLLLLPLPAEQKGLINRFRSEWRDFRSCTSGDDLQSLGIPAGPVYREILERLRDAWLNGEIQSEDEEKSMLKILVEKLHG